MAHPFTQSSALLIRLPSFRLCHDPPSKEPLPESSPFWRLSNVVLTSHNADYTSDYLELGWAVFADNAARFAAGGSLSTPIDVQRGY